MLRSNLMKFVYVQSRGLTKKVNIIQNKSFVLRKGLPLITCKRKEFDLYQCAEVNADAPLGEIPLASDGWQHYKSKNDNFTLHPWVVEPDQTDGSRNTVSFEQLGICGALANNIRTKLGIEETTFIQNEAIPKILAGDHSLIAAETGCGKTLAYLVPIVQNVLKRKQSGVRSTELNQPQVLILTPSRELADQIGEVATVLCRDLDVNIEVITGGKTKRKMLHPTLKEVDILIASLGVASKLTTNNVFRMDQVRHVVLDEFDTLLDDSFLDKLTHLMNRFPFYKNSRTSNSDEVSTQLVTVSATMPANVDELLQEIIDPSTLHEIISPNLHRILPNIKQRFIRIRKADRPQKLLELVKASLNKRRPIVIFSNKTDTSDFVSIFLSEHDIKVASLNGDLLYEIRVGLYKKFQNGQINVLSTTDVASRGLDTSRAQHVINYDFPIYMNDYIHRCGRIGRVNSAENGLVTNFVSGIPEVNLVRKIEHTARTRGILPNVDANITRIIMEKHFGEDYRSTVGRGKTEQKPEADPNEKKDFYEDEHDK